MMNFILGHNCGHIAMSSVDLRINVSQNSPGHARPPYSTPLRRGFQSTLKTENWLLVQKNSNIIPSGLFSDFVGF